VRNDRGDHILVGDACYACEVAETRVFPDYSDHEAMNRSLDALLAMREADTVMVWGHDRGQWGEAPVLPASRG
jgi:glyoxylase-like metal-dependent hydrolase (beta-lactamase superfamily II)